MKELATSTNGFQIAHLQGLKLDTYAFLDKRPDSFYTLPSTI
uniref:Uncharacterized protein n=1 Tax=Echinococcus canadensis TaxID=519352 RepID=A0A915EW55_9CEST